MKVLILDSRVIYELAVTRNINQPVVRNIISNLSDRYELRVSCLVKNYLEGLSSVIPEEKINSILNAFSSFFFDIDEDLITEFRKSDVADIYSAFEAAYAQIREDAFIVTTVPESFKGTGSFVCDSSYFSSELNDINNFIELNMYRMETRKQNSNTDRIHILSYIKKYSNSVIYENNNYYNAISPFIRNKFQERYNNSFEKFQEVVRENKLKKAYVIQVFSRERDCTSIEINFKSYQHNLRKSINSSGYFFQISQILVNTNSDIFKSIRSNRISQAEYQSLKRYSDTYGFENILNSGGIRAKTYNSI